MVVAALIEMLHAAPWAAEEVFRTRGPMVLRAKRAATQVEACYMVHHTVIQLFSLVCADEVHTWTLSRVEVIEADYKVRYRPAVVATKLKVTIAVVEKPAHPHQHP